MRLATVRIKNKKTGKTLIINQHVWAQDLGVGRFSDWTLDGGEKHGDVGAEDTARISSPEQFEKHDLHVSDAPSPAEEKVEEPVKDSEDVFEGITPRRGRGKK